MATYVKGGFTISASLAYQNYAGAALAYTCPSGRFAIVTVHTLNAGNTFSIAPVAGGPIGQGPITPNEPVYLGAGQSIAVTVVGHYFSIIEYAPTA